jgi:hypothetical protein
MIPSGDRSCGELPRLSLERAVVSVSATCANVFIITGANNPPPVNHAFHNRLQQAGQPRWTGQTDTPRTNERVDSKRDRCRRIAQKTGFNACVSY